MKKTLLLMAFAALVPAMSAEITGSGTAADPYKIATADDLTKAWSKMVEGRQIYFVQTADIDMSGVSEYYAISGFNGSYNYALHYDGQNHIIKNFAPAHRDAIANPNAYYCTTIFGVGTGTIKNLGVVNANVPVQQLEGGILGGFSGVGPGFQTIVTKTVLDNVFVQGKINNVAEYTPGAGNYTVTGGMFGMSGQPTEIRNCYVDVDVTGKAEAGGIFGSNGSPLAISNSYAAGQVKGTKSAMIACGSGAVTATDVISFGSTPALVGATSDGITAVAAGDEAAKATIKTWAAFNEGKMMNGYPTLNWVSADQGAEIPKADPDGSEANPYEIATADDLSNAWEKMVVGKQIYFVQTADIDMSGVTEHTAVSGFNGTYNYALHYDGQNHIIKNFAPAHRDAIANPNAYYCTTIFGVGTGTIKNLGVVNANVPVEQLEGGILGGFSGVGAGFQTIVTKTVVDNVFVQGKINNVAEYTPGAGNYTVTGGMFGMSGQLTEISDCYVDVNVTGKADAAGILGSNGSPLTISNSYAKGDINGVKTAMIACGSGSVTANDVITFGATPALNGASASGITSVAAGDASAIATIKTWAAFNEGKMMNGYPTLNWVSADQGSTGIDDIIVDNEDNSPVEYYNLNGVRVLNPGKGLYIKKQGQQVTKVMVR